MFQILETSGEEEGKQWRLHVSVKSSISLKILFNPVGIIPQTVELTKQTTTPQNKRTKNPKQNKQKLFHIAS